MPITDYVADANQVLSILLKAKEYLGGTPFSIAISNYSAEYVAIDSFVLDKSLFDSKQKEQEAIMPNLFIGKGKTEIASFKANVFFDSTTSVLFNVSNNDKTHSVLLNYSWQQGGKGSIDIITECEGMKKKISGNLFKRIYVENAGMKIVVFSNGTVLQIGFGNYKDDQFVGNPHVIVFSHAARHGEEKPEARSPEQATIF